MHDISVSTRFIVDNILDIAASVRDVSAAVSTFIATMWDTVAFAAASASVAVF